MHLSSMHQSPRTLHRLIVVRAIVASLMLGGCVEATAYEQATSAAEVQAEGRRRAGQDLERRSAELQGLRKEYERLKAENSRLEDQLAQGQGVVDQVELDLVLAKQERSEEASLVQQLRGDLARVGSHLDVFADEKAGLGSQLAAARADNDRLSARLARSEAELARLQAASATPAAKEGAEEAPEASEPLDLPADAPEAGESSSEPPAQPSPSPSAE